MTAPALGRQQRKSARNRVNASVRLVSCPLDRSLIGAEFSVKETIRIIADGFLLNGTVFHLLDTGQFALYYDGEVYQAEQVDGRFVICESQDGLINLQLSKGEK